MNRDRALDQCKTAAFLDSNAAFLGCLLCNLTFEWNDKVTQTACVTDTTFHWNPYWFDTLSPEERKGVLMHELWHIALLHGLRGKDKEHLKWNVACDYRINSNLVKDGYILPDGALLDSYFDDPDWSEEKIYNYLPDQNLPEQAWGTGTFSDSAEQVTIVQNAMVSARFAGDVPGEVEEVMKNFLKPKLNWKQLLHRYLLDKIDPEWSWNKPNKRYRDIYMPTLLPQEGRLITVAMFLDTSGSIEDEDAKRFISEVKYVQEVLNPEKLYVVQFDTVIQDEKVYTENHPFNSINVKGRGGTDYECIRQYILKYKPTVSIIFTDLYADDIGDVGKNELIWIVKNNPDNAPKGITIHVD